MSIKALSGKVFLLITGASRGIGRQIAISFSSLLEEGSHVLLLAKNVNALKETASKLPSNLSVDYVSIDLGTSEKTALEEVLAKSLKDKDIKAFNRIVVVHNVGTLGDVTQHTKDMTNLDTWQKFYTLNMFIPAIFNGVIMDLFNNQKGIEISIINITSLLGIEPQKSLGYYCSVKAAKELFFKVFALENPHIDVLNYSPGPVNTDMFDSIRKDAFDENIRQQFNELAENKTVLTAEQTVKRLLEVLKDHKYKSGDHVDYYDEL